MRVLISLPLFVLAVLNWTRSSEATFHEWKIDQVYTNVSGTIQYVDFLLTSPTDDERSLQFAQLNANLNSNSMGFTNLPDLPVDGQHFLVATPGFAAIAGVTPDYVFPFTPFFNPAGDTVNYGPNIDTLTFGAFSDGILAASHGGSVLNSPTNFAGVVGFVPEPTSGVLFIIGVGALLAVACCRTRLLS